MSTGDNGTRGMHVIEPGRERTYDRLAAAPSISGFRDAFVPGLVFLAVSLVAAEGPVAAFAAGAGLALTAASFFGARAGVNRALALGVHLRSLHPLQALTFATPDELARRHSRRGLWVAAGATSHLEGAAARWANLCDAPQLRPHEEGELARLGALLAAERERLGGVAR